MPLQTSHESMFLVVKNGEEIDRYSSLKLANKAAEFETNTTGVHLEVWEEQTTRTYIRQSRFK